MVNDINSLCFIKCLHALLNFIYAIIARTVHRQVVVTFIFYMVLTGVLLYYPFQKLAARNYLEFGGGFI